jgi:hypothetical protein
LNGAGCAQIKFIIENAFTSEEPLWYAGISVAARCVDADTAIHKLSERPTQTYDEQETEAKGSTKPRRSKMGAQGATSLRNSTQADAKVVP